MKSIRIRSKYQVTLPREVVQGLKCQPGDLLTLKPDGDTIIVQRKLDGGADYEMEVRERNQVTLPQKLLKDMFVNSIDVICYILEPDQVVFYSKGAYIPANPKDYHRKSSEEGKTSTNGFKPKLGEIY